MLRALKNRIQLALRERGIELRKFPGDRYAPLPVFHLAVKLLMAQRGEALTFVQVGANDGVTNDPLRALVVAHPWRGVLIEPQPDIFERLKANYQQWADRLSFENLAISNTGEGFTLYRAPAALKDKGFDDSTVVSGDAAVTARQMKLSVDQLEKFVVPAMSLDGLFKKHGFETVDLLQVDAEGYDWQILQTLDLKRLAPAIIQFEHGHLSRPDCAAAAEWLTEGGYVVYWGGRQHDALAIRKDVFELDKA